MLRTQVMASDDETDERVAARMDRQVILARDKPPMLWDFDAAPPVAYQDTAARGQIIEDGDDIGAISLLWDTLNSDPRRCRVRRRWC